MLSLTKLHVIFMESSIFHWPIVIEHFSFCRVNDMKSGNFTRQCALVIDGPSLAVSLKHGKELLHQICNKVDAVLGCRLSPLQKAQVHFSFQCKT